ncbi:CHAT domain-containing protein [Nocardia vinacea]|uniref:CHAT domain-containing protein n=1 Tax=Nocardia vinacea TaxID=96468 RepID=UPI0034336585
MVDRSYLPELGQSLIRSAEQFLAAGDSRRALDASDEAVEIFQELEDSSARRQLARALMLQAVSNLALGQLEMAHRSAQQCRELYETVPDGRGVPLLSQLIVAMELVGTILLQLGRSEHALQTADAALRMISPLRRTRWTSAVAAFQLLRVRALKELGREAEAVEALRSAPQPPSAAGGRLRPATMADLIGDVLDSRIEWRTVRREAAESVRGHQDIGEGSPPAVLLERAGKLRQRTLQLREEGDLGAALGAADEAVEFLQVLEHHNHESYALPLSDMLVTRGFLHAAACRETGDASRLDPAISDIESALALADTPDQRSQFYSVLSQLRLWRAKIAGSRSDVDKAITASMRLLDSMDNDAPDRDELAQAIGGALMDLYQLTHAQRDLDRAIEICRRSLADGEMAHRAGLLERLAAALIERYDHSGALADIEEAIAVARARAAAMSTEHPSRGNAMYALGAVLARYSLLTGDATAIDEAVAVDRAAIAATPADDPAVCPRLASLAAALLLRHESRGAAQDLEEAIALARTAVERTDSGGGIGLRHNLATALYARYRRSGTPEDIDQAIAVASDAVAGLSDYSDNHVLMLKNLVAMLLTRFQDTGQRVDLERASSLAREVLNRVPPGSPWYSQVLDLLGDAYTVSFSKSARSQDLSEAINARTLLVSGLSADNQRAETLTELSGLLMIRARRSASVADWERAVDAARRAWLLVAHDDPEYTRTVYHLAFALINQWHNTKNHDCLDETIRLLAASLHDRPRERSYRSERQQILNYALQARLVVTSADDDVPVAGTSQSDRIDPAAVLLHTFSEAGRGWGGLTPLQRIHSAYQVGRLALAAGRNEQALAGFRLAIELMPCTAGDRLWHESSTLTSASLTELVSDAFACAIEMGQPGQALSLLEEGRALLLGRAVGEDDTLALKTIEPDLAARTDHLRNLLNDTAALTLTQTEQAAQELDELIARIRALPDCEEFLRPSVPVDLGAAAESGPVVVINISDFRCDAVALTADGIITIPLPDLSRETATAHARTLLNQLRLDYRPVEDRLHVEDKVTQILAWLWDSVAEPILLALHLTDRPIPGAAHPRIWWVPTGPLTVLPLHAAGRGDINVLDLTVSSYAASVTTLLEARTAARTDDRGTRGRLILVPNPTYNKYGLPHAEREARTVSRILSSAHLLAGAEALALQVRDALPHNGILHFAGHSRFDSTDPLRSGLILADGSQLHPSDLLSHAAYPKLMVLSACSSATSMPVGVGETVNIGTLFQQAGAINTICTLWEVDDRSYSDIASEFFTNLSNRALETTQSALALHETTEAFRARYPHIPSLWASHIHLGP